MDSARRRILAASSLLLPGAAALSSAAYAGPGNPVAGKDYLVLNPPLAVDAGERVDVVEFFGYFCPHCNAFDPVIESWVRRMGPRIRFRRSHVVFRDAMLPQAQLYAVLEVLGKTETLHTKVFRAMHDEKLLLADEKQVADFAEKNGIPRQQYLDTLRSPLVQERMKQMIQAQYDCKVESVPTMAIDGRFVTSPDILRDSVGEQPEQAQHLATLLVLQNLLTRIERERKAAKGAVIK